MPYPRSFYLYKHVADESSRFTLLSPIDIAIPVIRLNTPAAKVLSELRHGPRTVEELAKALRITGNAVRNQLGKLEAENLVTRAGARPGTSKPSTLYAITVEGQIHFSTLYLPVLTQFLRVAEGKCSGTQLESFMTETGKSLAKRYPRPTGAVRLRANAAARLLKSFGGIAEVRTRDGTLVIQSLSCPLAALTSEHPAACNILEGFLTHYVGAPVKSCCSLGEEPRCCFDVNS
jgi:predicted ArsR family transcriptional regulator